MWEIPRNPNFDKAIKEYKLFPITHLKRWDILILLIRQYKLKTIAEIGTYFGATAMRILREHYSFFEKGNLGTPLQFEHYYMIDHRDHKPCRALAKKYPKISTFIHKPSIEAAKDFKDGSLDLVFIDAAHWYEDARKDMEAWLPKVKKGGWITGHDLYIITYEKWHDCVRHVVDDVLGYRDYYVYPEVEPWARGCTFAKRIM